MRQYLSGMQRISKVAVVRQLDDGGVDTIFNGAEQIDSIWNRKMLIEGRVFHVTSVFDPGEKEVKNAKPKIQYFIWKAQSGG